MEFSRQYTDYSEKPEIKSEPTRRVNRAGGGIRSRLSDIAMRGERWLERTVAENERGAKITPSDAFHAGQVAMATDPQVMREQVDALMRHWEPMSPGRTSPVLEAVDPLPQGHRASPVSTPSGSPHGSSGSSYLENFLASRFDASIAAADSSKKAGELLTQKIFTKRDVFLADRFEVHDDEVNIWTAPLGVVPISTTLTDERTAQIMLSTTDRRNAEGRLQPMLLAVINNDIAIEIARFENRPDSEYSYVQLGQEIAEDNLVVTAKDRRTHQVDAIRNLLNTYGTDADPTPENMTILSWLIEQELAEHSGRIDELLHPSLRKLIDEKYKDTKQLKYRAPAILFGKHDEIAYDQQVMPLITEEFLSSNNQETNDEFANRHITLALIRNMPEEPKPLATESSKSKWYQRVKKGKGQAVEHQAVDDTVRLVALTRDNVAVELAMFNNSMVFAYANDGQYSLATTDQLKALRNFLKHDTSAYAAIREYRKEQRKNKATRLDDAYIAGLISRCTPACRTCKTYHGKKYRILRKVDGYRY